MLPIPMDIIRKSMEIPEKIAELSYKDESLAIKYMRIWGERKQPITILYEKITKELG